ncbi:hypothetical protein [Schaalia hyovaginalis]|uniref:hypothetical protein n=1 Tax=Schaalia hyovaginalis TaxID=29316 RepID=UPI002A75FCEC|nr:hypothetical protein [Schaalia hyovaginalis]MDY2669795.1 hypothetical protein [Schaalia hyovaginalis]
MEVNAAIAELDPGSLAEWAGVLVTVAIALISGLFALWRSHRSKRSKSDTTTTKHTTDATTGSHSQTSFSDEPSGMKSDAAYTHVTTERPRVEITWSSKNALTIRNRQLTPLSVDHIRNRDEFVRLDLDDRFTLDPGRSIRCLALGAWGQPIPDELVLDIVGEDSPLAVPMPPNPFA